MFIRTEGTLAHDLGHGNSWKITMKAARLVPSFGDSALPPPIGNVPIIQLPGTKLGIQHDPVNSIYPNTAMRYGLLVMEPRFMVVRDGVRGLAVYVDNNGSCISASVTSQGGHNPLAPLNWRAGSGDPLRDPTARLAMEWRTMADGNVWMSHAIHGWDDYGRAYNCDWRDGSPVELETMYDPQLGRVRQTVWVPSEIRGLGVAEQTLREDDLRGTYTIAVWAPNDIAYPYRLQSSYSGGMRSRSGGLESFSKGVDYGLESMGAARGPQTYGSSRSTASAPPPSHKVAAGGTIRQHIIANPFGPGHWEKAPKVVFRLFPVTPQQAAEITAIQMDAVAGGQEVLSTF